MKQITLLLTAVLCCLGASAQKSNDTLRIGNMVIVKDGKKGKRNVYINKNDNKRKRPNLSTNWGIVDLGFANYEDKTNYGNTGTYLVNRPGAYPLIGKNDLKLRSGKSINVNIWFFMQKLNLVKHKVNLKYGLGLELNNYRYKSFTSLSYKEGGAVPYSFGTITNEPFIFRDSISFSKNKLAADYLTVPVMLNFATHNNQRKGVSLSVGVSAGYLYSQRNKQKSDERGKLKNKGEYDMERFKFSYIAEASIMGIRFYGSYSPKSMYQHSLDIRPYTVGLRFSNW